jgi:hypothetical protein
MSNEVIGKEAKVKVPKEPKEPRLRKGLTQDQWKEKLSSMTVDTVPEGWLGMSEIVSKAREAGIKVSRICSAMGGDRGMGVAWDPIFAIVYVGGRKYGSPEILTKGFQMLLDPEYHKAVHAGRPKVDKAAKTEAQVEANAPSVKVKVNKPWGG